MSSHNKMDAQGYKDTYGARMDNYIDYISILFENPEAIFPELSGDMPKDLLDNVIKNLTVIPSESHGYIPPYLYAVRSAGKKPKKSNGADADNESSVHRLAAAETMLFSRKAFSINMTRTGDDMRFVFGVDNETPDILAQKLRGYFGQIKLEEYEPGKAPYYSGEARCRKLCLDEEEKNANETSEKYSINWPSAVALADLQTDFSAEIRFEPVRQELIKNRLKDIDGIYKELIGLNNITFQTSMADNTSNQTMGNILTQAGRNIFGGKNENSSDSFSHTLSMSRVKKYATLERMQKLLEAEAKTLTDALHSGAFNIFVRCRAEDEDTLEVLSSILGAALLQAGLFTTWKDSRGDSSDNNPSAFITLKDVHRFLQLPNQDFEGFEVKENDELAVNLPDYNGDIILGRILQNGHPLKSTFKLHSDALNRHAFICGMTGAGKSNTLFNILEHSPAPFLVIEPVKSEYRALASAVDNLTVQGMNLLSDNPLRINPFWFPPGSSLSFHIDAIKTIISSSFSLHSAMPNILEQCIYLSYVNQGWDVIKGVNVYAGSVSEEYLYPTFSDLCREIEIYLEKSNYTGEALSTYQGALLSRLQSFTTGFKGILLNTPVHPDYSKWLSGSNIIELDAMADDADKCIVMGAILVQYFGYLKSNNKAYDGVRHLTVIEEAHRLFKNIDQGSKNAEVADPAGKLVETLQNMMAEIRAYGEGILIVDQSPTKVAEDVIKNSSTKIVHRLDSKKDIEAIEASLLLKESGTLISSLPCGTALIRCEKMVKPAKVEVEKSTAKGTPLKDAPVVGSNSLNDSASADFVLMNTEFKEELSIYCDKLLNHILYDDLGRAKAFLGQMLENLREILFDYGYGHLTDTAERSFYKKLVSDGIKLSTEKSFLHQGKLILLVRMFFERFFDIAYEYELTSSEISAFSAFRRECVYTLMEKYIVNTAGRNREEANIARLYGRYTLYTKLIKSIINHINQEDEDSGTEEVTWEWAENAVSICLPYLFLVSPEDMFRANLVRIIQNIYEKIAIQSGNEVGVKL